MKNISRTETGVAIVRKMYPSLFLTVAKNKLEFVRSSDESPDSLHKIDHFDPIGSRATRDEDITLFLRKLRTYAVIG